MEAPCEASGHISTAAILTHLKEARLRGRSRQMVTAQLYFAYDFTEVASSFLNVYMNIMLPASQRSRPRVGMSFDEAISRSLTINEPRRNPPQNPLYQQQIRAVITPASSERASESSPKCQIEAMPPNEKYTPAAVAAKQQAPQHVYNAAFVHPVFFTSSWRKPPFPLPINPGLSPAATGYVFGNAHCRTESKTKL